MSPNRLPHTDERTPVTAPGEPVWNVHPSDVRGEIADAKAAVQEGRQRLVKRLRRIWRRRAHLIRFAVGGFLLSTAAAFVLPRQFRAMTRLMPPDPSSASAGSALLAAASGAAGSNLGSLAGGFLGMKSSGALFVGILESETVQENLVRRFDLQKIYRDRYAIDARRDLADHSSIFEDRKSGIITIEVRDSDPERAAAIAHGYTDELNALVNRMSTSSARREREFLEERLTAVQSDLSEAEKNWSDFASRSGAIDIQTEGKAMIEGAATLQGRLIAAESELQGLREIYTEDNVRTRSLRAQIAELKSQLGKIGGASSSGEIGESAASDGAGFPPIRRLPLLGVAYADLYRREKTEEAVFETLTREYELAKVQEAKETPSVKVLDPARVPEKKSFPPRLVVIALGTSIAIAAGFFWLVVRMAWDEIDAHDPRREFALEIYRDASSRISWQGLGASLSNLASRPTWSRSSRRERAATEHD